VRSPGDGDTTLVLKRRIEVDADSAFGLELGAKLPAARRGLGSGKSDVGFNAIYSRDLAERWHADVNLLAARLGGVEPGLGRWQRGLAAALSHGLDERWSLVGELSGTERRGSAHTAQALAAASYAPRPSLVLDFGVSKGLEPGSGGWSLFSGLTLVWTRLF